MTEAQSIATANQLSTNSLSASAVRSTREQTLIFLSPSLTHDQQDLSSTISVLKNSSLAHCSLLNPSVSPSQCNMAKRSYKAAFLDIGFTCLTDKGIVRPQCVVCHDVLSNEALKESKLKRHLATKHPDYVNVGRDVFKRKADAIRKQRLDCRQNPTVIALDQVRVG